MNKEANSSKGNVWIKTKQNRLKVYVLTQWNLNDSIYEPIGSGLVLY